MKLDRTHLCPQVESASRSRKIRRLDRHLPGLDDRLYVLTGASHQEWKPAAAVDIRDNFFGHFLNNARLTVGLGWQYRSGDEAPWPARLGPGLAVPISMPR